MGRHDTSRGAMRQAVTGFVLVAAAAILPAGAGAETISDFAPFVYDTGSPQVLRLEGEINVRSPLSLSRALRRFPDIKTLELSSPGGSVYAALTMAPSIRDAGLTTVIPAGAQCFSACAYLFFAGLERTALGELGVHQVSAENLASGQFAVGDIVAVLSDFDVPSEVLVKMLQTPPEGMYVMSPDEMARLGLLVTASAAGARDAVATARPFEIGLTKSGDSDEYQQALHLGALEKIDQEKLAGDAKQALIDSVNGIPQKIDEIQALYDKGSYIDALMAYSAALDVINGIVPKYHDEMDVIYFAAFSGELLMKLGLYKETAEVAEQIISGATDRLGADHEVIARCRKLLAEAKAQQ